VLSYALLPRLVHPAGWTLRTRTAASGVFGAALERRGLIDSCCRALVALPSVLGIVGAVTTPGASHASTPRERGGAPSGAACGWCGDALRVGARSHARWHGGTCKANATRALRETLKRVPQREREHVRRDVAMYELAGATRREAITRALTGTAWP